MNSPVRNAMTLVEILAVVVILGLLATTLVVGISGKMGRAKTEIARTQIAQLVGQVQSYQLERNAYPNSSQGLSALTAPLAAPNNTYFIEPGRLMDPWGRAYLYVIPGPAGHPYEILTHGSDGQPGGVGEAVDISSSNLGK
jgi:general secretion pathway protein G